MTDGNIIGWRAALREELYAIEDRRRKRAGEQSPAKRDEHEDYAQIAKRLQPTALCLSGGGIRSASFCLLTPPKPRCGSRVRTHCAGCAPIPTI
jgi:hypothetical protein